MMEYYDIYTVCCTYGKNYHVQCGTKTETMAAEIAAKTIKEDIGYKYLFTNMDYQQTYEVIEIDSPITSGEVKKLTEEQIIQVLSTGSLIQFIDADGDICEIWISSLRVFN